jgi:ABC-type polysaccharide/polyol phosphate export permease
MLEALRELITRRDLLYTVTWREIKVRYKQSVMGIVWAVLLPMVIVLTGLIVRLAFAKLSGSPLRMADVTAVAVKAAPWAFFVGALRFGTNSLVANANLVTKVYLPRLIFPLAAVLAQCLDFLVAATVIGVFLAVVRVGLSVHILWLPVLVGGLLVFAAGLAIFLSAASLFFRDVKYLVEVLLTFAIFFTPVFYDAALFGAWAPVLLLNPVSPILEGISAVVVHHRPPTPEWTAYSVLVAAAIFAAAVAFFRKVEPYFAESV